MRTHDLMMLVLVAVLGGCESEGGGGEGSSTSGGDATTGERTGSTSSTGDATEDSSGTSSSTGSGSDSEGSSSSTGDDTDTDTDADTDGDTDTDDGLADIPPPQCKPDYFPESARDCGVLELGDCEDLSSTPADECDPGPVHECVLKAIEVGDTFEFTERKFDAATGSYEQTRFKVLEGGRVQEMFSADAFGCVVVDTVIRSALDLDACEAWDCVREELDDAWAAIECGEETHCS